jgi:hypothetical protein
MIRMSILLASLAIAPAALAQNFSIDWYTIEAGGPTAGGTFNVYGVIGQPDAGPTLAGGTFQVTGGYLTGRSAPSCPADLDDGTGTGVPDGGVGIEDLLYYLQVFSAGQPRADLDDGSGSGVPDGGVTIDDLLYFLARFNAGC